MLNSQGVLSQLPEFLLSEVLAKAESDLQRPAQIRTRGGSVAVAEGFPVADRQPLQPARFLLY